MKSSYVYLLVIQSIFCGWVIAAPVDSARAERIAERSLCLGCHKIEGKSVGPSFQLIAKRYQQNPKAIELLTGKVKNGGSGNWGVVAMPANAKNIRDEDLQIVLQWILAGAPKKN